MNALEWECPPTILIVDDDPSLCATLGVLFGEEGFEVATAGSAGEALAAMDDLYADIVVLDLLMPASDGWQFLENMPAGLDPRRVVVLSAMSDAMSMNHAWRLGVGMYMTKPFDPSILVRRVREILDITAPVGRRV